MSNLLERAIIDAKALKEAALKNAEQLVVEKYQLEVKEAMDKLLEAEGDDLGMDDLFGADSGNPVEDLADETEEPEVTDSLTADDIESEMPNAFDTDDDQIIQIKLDSLEDDFEDEEEEGVFGGDDELEDDEIGIDIEDDSETMVDPDMDMDAGSDIGIDIGGDISPDALEEMIASALQDVLHEEEEEEEEINEEEELDEEIDLDELMERVRVEGEPQKSGWAGTPESVMKEYEAMLLAREQDSEVKEENEELRKNVAALQKENKTLSSAALKLQEQNKEYITVFETMQEKLETMNVSNAKLLYINQALENASLNERQKRKIVEAISKAGTVQEAKIVFDTMSDAVSTTSDVKKDSTLNEVVSRKSSLLVAARKEQTQKDANPLFNRMQTLAGIKTK
tara:strand:- start:535 stop:1725 length:1191 start_codon:yes stop_codon:yes gene_type:complete